MISKKYLSEFFFLLSMNCFWERSYWRRPSLMSYTIVWMSLLIVYVYQLKLLYLFKIIFKGQI